MRFILSLMVLIFLSAKIHAQTAAELIQKVRTKLEKVTTYQAQGTLKTNVTFIKAPIAHVKIYFKRPNKLKIINEKGISFIPKGTVNISIANIFQTNYDVIDVGKDNTGLRIIKLLPKEDTADIILSTLYIDEKEFVIRKSQTTTKENGTYELEMTYGTYADYGLPDKVIFSFNTKDYKMPKGVTLDYDDGTKKQPDALKNKKGKVEIVYSNYQINQPIADNVFQ